MSPARRPGSTTSNSARAREQYHHAIPRFILRRFVDGPEKSKAQRKKQYRKTRVDPDYVLFYDVAEKTLISRSIGNVYGVMNLYSDQFAADFDELEKKFSRLERDAAIIIEAIHTTGRSGKVVMNRKEVQTLRKFLFLQHYRGGHMSQSYFDPDQNEIGHSWIKRYMQKYKLPSHRDLWIHFLRYYLDTSHSQINMHALEIYQKYGGALEFHGKMLSGADSDFDPDIEHYPAIAYQVQAEMFFLCIWEAAEGEEFILTSRGFGLWEGRVAGEPEAHRLFVISPRYAIVLRSNSVFMEMRGGGIPLSGDFEDVVQERPVCNHIIPYDEPGEVEAYRTSARASRDLFTFKVTRLTTKQTFAMNSVHLVNLPDKGSVTFLSRECMLRTLRNHMKSFRHFLDFPKYLPLVNLLSPPDLSGGVHMNLYVTLMRIANGNCREEPKYDRAVAVVDLLGREPRRVTLFATEHLRLSSTAIEFCKTRLGLSRAGKQKASDAKPFKLVSSLPSDKSRDLFAAMFSFLETLDVKQSTDPLDALQNDMMVIGVLRWAASDGEAFVQMENVNETLGRALKDIRVLSEPSSNRVADNISADDMLQLTIHAIEAGTVKYESEYDRARVLYSICSRNDALNAFSSECKRVVQIMIERFTLSTKPPPAGFQSRPEASLVEKLPENVSRLLLAVLELMVKELGYSDSDAQGDLISTLGRHCVCIGLLTWIARNRHDVVSVLGIPVIQDSA